jgi:integrase
MRLLLGYLYETTGVAPSRLDFEHLDATRTAAFLDHLQKDRHASVATRNARLAAVHSLFRFAALQHPEHAETIARVLAIQPKHGEQEEVPFLTVAETEALLAAPDLARRTGRRDRAMLLVAAQTGLRVSELVSLRTENVHFGTGAHVDCLGKGRKYRSTPLTPQVAEILQAWLRERGGSAADPVFPGPRGEPLSRDAARRLVDKYVAAATPGCPSFVTKRISAHSLRHTAAMRLLENGTDVVVTALLLGHWNPRTTAQIYLHANMALKEKALARTAPLRSAPGRYHPPDQLLAFLEQL